MTDHPKEGAGMSQTRLRNERWFHDQQAAERARVMQAHDYRFDDESYLHHESWIAPAIDALGELAGRRVLDLGCGHGMASVVFARRGARVIGCDLSLGYLREARKRAEANGMTTRWIVCDGEQLPFADQSFDRIWGNAILHHLDLRSVTRELYRVLAPGGVGVFCEPWGGNRWLNWARQRLHYPGKQRTADETPLRPCDLVTIRERFPLMQVQGFQLLSMLGRAVKQPRLVGSLAWCDRQLLSKWPGWQQYCRYVVVTVRKKG
jgi:SAM-dependent methyltransferase